MTISVLRGLSIDEKKQAILRLSQFVLREPSIDVRESIYKRLLEIGIYLLGKGEKVTIDMVLDIIANQFFGIKLEKSIAEEYMKQLHEKEIVEMENGKYFLLEQERSQIENYAKQALTLVSTFEAKFVESVKQKKGGDISKDENVILIDCFYQFVIRLVSRYITSAARLFIKGTLARIPLSTGRTLLEVSTSAITEENLRNAARTTLADWMQHPDEEFVQYLYHMRQNFLCMEVLNLDPECRMVEREEFPKKRLFLDTNVMLELIVKFGRLHEQTKKLVENTRQLRCSVYVTKKTIDEFNFLIDKTKKLLSVIKATPKQLSIASNLFIQEYGKTLLSGNVISTTEFMSQFSEFESLLASVGVEIIDEDHQEIKELPEYDGLTKEVQKCYVKYRQTMKTIDVAQHDAFHLLLVKTLRQSEVNPILGPNNWFISYDSTLPCCDKFINNNFSFPDSNTPVMLVEIWNEIISPFLIGIVAEKDLVAVFKSFISSNFAPISEGVNFGRLAKLEIDWTEYDWLEIEEIQEITNQRFVLNYISRMEELLNTGDRETIEKSRSEFNIAFSRFIGHISNRKIEQVKNKLEEKEKETQELKLSVKGLEKTKNELRASLTSEKTLALRMRYLTGFAGICSLIVGGGLIILMMKETTSWQVATTYIVFLIIGAILLLMAIDPERVSAVLRLGQKE